MVLAYSSTSVQHSPTRESLVPLLCGIQTAVHGESHDHRV